MNQFLRVYEEKKIFDQIFHKLYNNFSRDTVEKNIVALLVEIGELANETRCFKYWLNKGASEKDVVLDEYADCFLLTLYFCNIVDIDLNEEFPEITNNDVVAQFKDLYVIISGLEYNLNREVIKLILSNLVNLGTLLGFTAEDITNGCINKIKRNKKRFEINF